MPVETIWNMMMKYENRFQAKVARKDFVLNYYDRSRNSLETFCYKTANNSKMKDIFLSIFNFSFFIYFLNHFIQSKITKMQVTRHFTPSKHTRMQGVTEL